MLQFSTLRVVFDIKLNLVRTLKRSKLKKPLIIGKNEQKIMEKLEF